MLTRYMTSLVLAVSFFPAAALAQFNGTVWENTTDASNAGDPVNQNAALPHANFTSPAIQYCSDSSVAGCPASAGYTVGAFLNNPTFTGAANGFNAGNTLLNTQVQLLGSIFLNAGSNGFQIGHDDGVVLQITGGPGTATCSTQSGALCVNVPGATAFSATNFTINASAAGIYTFTLNYSECCGPPAYLLFAYANGSPVGSAFISKSFGGSTVPLGGSTSLSFTVTNPNLAGTTLSRISFTDTLPAGLTVANPNGFTGNCNGGAITAAPGSGSVSLANATLGGGASCTFSVNVTGTATGPQNNSVTVTSDPNAEHGNTATASVTVVGAPAITKSFGAASIPLNGSTSLTFLIANPNTGSALAGVGFTDNLPQGLVVSSPNITGSCGGGVIIATPGTHSVSLAGATLPAATACTFSVTVAGLGAGVQNNQVTVTSTTGGTGNTSTASITVVSPPAITKTFNPTKIVPGGTSTVSFLISNPNSGPPALTGIAFTDALPANLRVATPNGLTSTCGGTATATAGSGTVSLTGATLAAGATCLVTVNVTAPEGSYSNSVQVTSTNGGVGNTSVAGLSVAAPPVISKSFGEVSIGPNNTVGLTFVVRNPNTSTTLTGIAFNDTLPAGFKVSNPSVVSGACDAGTISAIAGGNAISLATASLAPGVSCTFTVNVTADGTVLGPILNTSGAVTSLQSPAGNVAVASIFVGNPFQVTYAANLSVGDSFINITNTGQSGAALPSGTTAATTGAICANVYAFTPDEQLVACCSCPVTPNGLISLSVKNDLATNTLTPAVPTAVVVKVIATLPVGGSCTNSAAAVSSGSLALANGVESFSSTIHATPAAGTYGVTETRFSPATLSAGELSRVGNLCNFIIANGSGFGICRSCRLGGLGTDRQ